MKADGRYEKIYKNGLKKNLQNRKDRGMSRHAHPRFIRSDIDELFNFNGKLRYVYGRFPAHIACELHRAGRQLCAGRSDRSHENHGFQTPSMDRHCVCGIYPEHPASPHHIRFYFGLPNAGLRLDGFQAGTIALTIYTSAFIAEAIRAGIQTVSKGQMEAARSSGFTYSQAMRYVILPQAVKS